MNVSDRKLIIQECILQESKVRDLKKASRLHDKKLADAINEERKARDNRKLAMILHEKNNQLNLEARIKQVDARQEFLKMALKII